MRVGLPIIIGRDCKKLAKPPFTLPQRALGFDLRRDVARGAPVTHKRASFVEYWEAVGVNPNLLARRPRPARKDMIAQRSTSLHGRDCPLRHPRIDRYTRDFVEPSAQDLCDHVSGDRLIIR